MFIIVGLGNPGLKYDVTRHNIGFGVIDRIAHDHHIQVDRKKHQGLIGQGIIAGHKVILVKPQTYMNLSGQCIRAVLDYYNATIEDLIVIYDDTSLPFGTMRIRESGRDGGHNGIKNIILHLGTKDFLRIKVGVSEKPPGWDMADYVLSRFTSEELKSIAKVLEGAAKATVSILKDGPSKAMNQYNQKTRD